MPQEEFVKIVPSSSASLFYKRWPNKVLTYIPIKDKPFEEVIRNILSAYAFYAGREELEMSLEQFKELYPADKYSKEELESVCLECALNICNSFKILKGIIENTNAELSFDAYRTSD